MEKSRIKQMHYRMFNSTNILIYRCPSICVRFFKWLIRIMRIQISQIVPRRVNESIHRISFSSTFFPIRQNHILKLFRSFKRIPFPIKFNISRKFHRQVFFFFQVNIPIFIINYRNRSSPISLSTNQPIMKSIIYRFLTKPNFFQFFSNFLFCFITI